MLTTSVPIRGVAPSTRDDSTTGVFDLFDAAPTAGLELPCRASEADLWFADNPAGLERAKSLCVSCPVRQECLAGALARQEPWGVWGGEIFEYGKVIARKRPRGRPRKTVELTVSSGERQMSAATPVAAKTDAVHVAHRGADEPRRTTGVPKSTGSPGFGGYDVDPGGSQPVERTA